MVAEIFLFVQDFEAGYAAVFEDEVAGEGVFENLDIGSADGADEGGFDGEAGGVAAGVEDAGVGVGGLHASGEMAVVLVEADAEADEVADAGGAFGAEDLDGGAAVESGAGAEGVFDVLLDGVVGEHGGGDSALRVAGVGFREAGLGDQGDAVMPGELDGGDEAGDAAAYDDDAAAWVEDAHVVGLVAGASASMRSRATRAGMATDSGTLIWLRTSPFSKASRTQAR